MLSIRGLLTLSLLFLLAACATPFRSEVARFHNIQTVAPGSTFSIAAADEDKRGSLEFQTYAARVAQALAARGLRQAPEGAAGDYQVLMDYGIDDGRERIETRPGTGGWGYGYYPFYSRYWGRYGYGYGYGYGYPGWYDPFWGPWGGGFGAPEVYSYTEYGSYLTVRMNARSGPTVFEARALAETRSKDLTTLVPLLVQAMFADFPGASGQTVVVSIDDKGRATTKATRS